MGLRAGTGPRVAGSDDPPYTQPGVYTVTVTASDDQSLPFRINPEYVQTSVTRTVTITSAPNATPSPGVVALSR